MSTGKKHYNERKQVSSQVSRSLSDGQTRSLRAMNIEKEVEIAIFAAASNMAWMEEQGTEGKSS